MAISSLGISSGIDFETIVSQLIAAQSKPLVKLQEDQVEQELKSASVLSLKTKLSSFESSVNTLNSLSQFNTKSASVTKTAGGEELLSVSVDDTAVAGSTSIKVNQLATASKKGSQGFVDRNTTAIATSAGPFTFKIGTGGAETTINVSDTTTLEQFRDAINTANAGVTASILNDGTGSNPFRLILTANSSGSANDIIITGNGTDLDFTNKKIEDAFAFTTNSFSGTVASNTSGIYTGTTNKTFLIEIVDDTGGTPVSGTVKYKYSTDGGVTFLGANGAAFTGTNGVAIAADATLQNIDGQIDASTTTEGVKISFTGGTFVKGDKFSIDVFNPEMQAAQDAVIEVDNTTITKSSNTITDVIQGITLNLLKADSASTVTVTVSSDTSTAKDNITNFVDSFNVLAKFLDEQSSFNLDDEETKPLLGDFTLQTIRRTIGNIITGAIPGVSNTGFNNLSSIGITSDSKTGGLSIDDSKLSSALSNDPNAVAKLFVDLATPTDTAIKFLSKTAKTQAGFNFGISISTAPEQANLMGDNDLSFTGLGANETLTFLFSKDHTENSPNFTSFSVTLNSGSTINTIVNTLNSAFATNKVGLSAFTDSIGVDKGKLKIKSTDFGEDIFLQLTTDQVNDMNNDQIFDAATNDTLSDAGVDIVGSINNHSAVGKGDVLTGSTGFPEEGLAISTTSTKTGGMGTITASSGVVGQLSNVLAAFTNSTDGLLKTKTDSIQNTIDDIKEQQDKLQKKLLDKEEQLRAQFTRLEVIITKFKATGDFLTAQLANLPQFGKNS